MPLARLAKVASAFLLGFGIIMLVSIDDIAAASKKEEAKKYTDQLKKAKSTDVKGRLEAIQKLGELGQIQYAYTEAAIPDIIKATEDKDATIRAAAARSIGMIGVEDKAGVMALTKLLKDSNESVKFAAVEGLGYLNDKATSSLGDLRAIRKNLDRKDKLAKAIDTAVKSITGKKK